MSISFTMLFKYFISLVCLSTEQGAYWFEQEMNIRYLHQAIHIRGQAIHIKGQAREPMNNVCKYAI